MSDLAERINAFTAYLAQLAGMENRGALAELHSGLGRPPGGAPRMLKHVDPYLDVHTQHTDRWFYLVGTLFTVHPVSDFTPRLTLGGSFARIRDEMSESGEARFLALLSCHPDDLPDRLRGAIGFLASKGDHVGINWRQLMWDLCQWDKEAQDVQLTWARQFYREIAEKSSNESIIQEGE